MAKRITLAQIGKRVGVSPMTVSAVLNASSADSSVRVNPDTAEEIRRVAAEMGYQANLLARALRNRRSNTIGVIFRSVHAPSVMSVRIDILERRLFAAGYRSHLAVARGSMADLGAQINDLLAWQVDGLIIHDLFAEEYDERWRGIERSLTDRHVPLVICDSNIPLTVPCSTVASDHETGGELAADHLLSLGHRRLAFVGGRNGPPGQRLKGVQSTISRVRDATLAVVEPPAPSRADEPIAALTADAAAIVSAFLERRDAVTGVICGNDLTAATLVSALQRAGISVPRDISVIGYDDSEYAHTSNPPLTTIHQDATEIGRLSAELLLEQLAEPPKPRRKLSVMPTLVARESTAAPRHTGTRRH